MSLARNIVDKGRYYRYNTGVTVMKIDISSIKEGKGLSIVVDEDTLLSWDEDALNLRFESPWHTHAEVTHTGEGFILIGHVVGKYIASCDRCLNPVVNDLSVEFTDCFVPSLLAAEEQNAECKVFDKDIIDADESIVEAIVLNMPMKHLCRPDCAGLCPQCGHNLNDSDCECEALTDPRWDKLHQLLETKGGGQNGQS
jgi:uncharacterized protein